MGWQVRLISSRMTMAQTRARKIFTLDQIFGRMSLYLLPAMHLVPSYCRLVLSKPQRPLLGPRIRFPFCLAPMDLSIQGKLPLSSHHSRLLESPSGQRPSLLMIWPPISTPYRALRRRQWSSVYRAQRRHFQWSVLNILAEWLAVARQVRL